MHTAGLPLNNPPPTIMRQDIFLIKRVSTIFHNINLTIILKEDICPSTPYILSFIGPINSKCKTGVKSCVTIANGTGCSYQCPCIGEECEMVFLVSNGYNYDGFNPVGPPELCEIRLFTII